MIDDNSTFHDLLCKYTAKVRKVTGKKPNGVRTETIIITGPQKSNTRITVACNSAFDK